MRLPKEIQGRQRIRDLDICRLYIDGHSAEEIKELRTLPITVRAIHKILSKNKQFINPRIQWDKSKRIAIRQRLIQKKLNDTDWTSKKDVIDHLEGLRVEIEGEKSLVDQSTHKHITVILDSNAISPEQAANGVLDRA